MKKRNPVYEGLCRFGLSSQLDYLLQAVIYNGTETQKLS